LPALAGHAKSLPFVIKACKNIYAATAQHMRAMFTAAVYGSKEIDLRVKYAAERAIKYLIEGRGSGGNSYLSTGSALFQQFLARGDQELVKGIKDCQRRLLATSNLAERSDDEEDLSTSVLSLFNTK
jgi:hypothetical protein